MMLDLFLALLANPFDPRNNIALFSAIDRRLPQPTDRLPPEDPTEAWRVLCHIRAAVERTWGAGWQWPEEHAFKSVWPGLTPRARWLVLWHDALHAAHGIEQNAAGEYELAVRLLSMPSRWFRISAMPKTLAGLHRVYGALALATLPVGVARAGLAPLRGALAGLRGAQA